LLKRYHAWDTETVDIDAKVETPVGNGRVICASAFCGIDVDFGNGPSKPYKNAKSQTFFYFI